MSVTTVPDVIMRDKFSVKNGTGCNYEGHILVTTVSDVIMKDVGSKNGQS